MKSKNFKVIFKSQGPSKELYLAEEAIGLAKALNWSIVNGPFWREFNDESTTKGAIILEENQKNVENEDACIDLDEEKGRGRRNSILYRRKIEQEKLENEWSTMNDTDLKNGDYVVTPCLKGVYHVLMQKKIIKLKN
jgi:hypothetical protein